MEGHGRLKIMGGCGVLYGHVGVPNIPDIALIDRMDFANEYDKVFSDYVSYDNTILFDVILVCFTSLFVVHTSIYIIFSVYHHPPCLPILDPDPRGHTSKRAK